MNLAPVALIDIERRLATESGKRAVSHVDLSTLIPNVEPSSGKPSAYVFAPDKTQYASEFGSPIKPDKIRCADRAPRD